MIAFQTTRLCIRDHQSEDLDSMHRLFSNAEAMRYLTTIRTTTLDETFLWLEEAIKQAAMTERTKWYFAVTEQKTGKYLGEMGYVVLEDSAQGRVVDLGFFLEPAHWGKGYAAEAAEAVLRFAFTEGSVHKVIADCLSENQASEKVMKKLGMTCEGELLEHTLHEGVLKNRVLYRLIRHEWLQRSETSLFGKALPAESVIFPIRNPKKRPKAILFDYGQTLFDEEGFDALAGTAAVLREAVDNPHGVSAEEVQELADTLLRELGRRGVSPETQHPLEFHNHLFYRFLYESFGVQFTKTLDEVERIFWDTAAPGRSAPGVERLLEYLSETGIRTGVISNISFSGRNLQARIERAFSTHHFSCILASSEYLFRKPHGRIFEMALRKLDLPPEDVWYCGDHAWFDVHGATKAGLFPVWYTGSHPHAHDVIPGFSRNVPVDPCLEISDWATVPALLERLPEG